MVPAAPTEWAEHLRVACTTVQGRETVDERHDLLVRAAWLYHERRLNQQEVADRLQVSRSTVSRLLAAAEAQGIVRVVLTVALPEAARLEDALIERYGLSGATVAMGAPGETPMDTAARAMARRLADLVAPGHLTIASGWGRTLARAAHLVSVVPTAGVHLIDAFGHTTTAEMTASVEVTNALAGKFGAKVTHLPSPGFATSERALHTFHSSESVLHVLEMARRADVVILAVGVVGPESLLIEGGFIDHPRMDRLRADHAVGEIFGLYFRLDGSAIDPQPLRPVSLSLDDLRSSPRTIAAVGGATKRDAVRGALAAGVVTELAVDDSLAAALLDVT